MELNYKHKRRSEMDYEKIVRDVIEEHRVSPVDMMGIGDITGEYAYLNSHIDSYVRTVREVDSLYKDCRSSSHVLEIGSFLGPVSISLKRIGYQVSAMDIPEFYKSDSLKKLYENNRIPFVGLNLKRCKLPYESDLFDVVIACEVIEHLNFNPLPVLKEINRILKTNGRIYIGMPNQSSIVNRVKLIFGRSILNPIDDYFRQLDRSVNMIVGLHWREYTLDETIQMTEKMGFKIISKYYFAEKGQAKKNIFMKMLLGLLYSYPPFRRSQVVIATKIMVPNYDFWMTDANS
jgi:SAM-dependent methyltransferase